MPPFLAGDDTPESRLSVADVREVAAVAGSSSESNSGNGSGSRSPVGFVDVSLNTLAI